MKSNDSKMWLTEYETFLKSDSAVSSELDEKVYTRMKPFLNPSGWSIFGKILGVHVIVGFLSLGICHQFGMNPFGTERSLADWFMAMGGHSVCMILCGVTFLSLSVLASGIFLSIEEVRALKRNEFIQTFALGIVSLTLFAMFGAELAVTFAGLWLLGALVGGYLATEVLWKFRQRFLIGVT